MSSIIPINKNKHLLLLFLLMLINNTNVVTSEEIFLYGDDNINNISVPNVFDTWSNSTLSYLYSKFKDIPPSLVTHQMLTCYRDVGSVIKGVEELKGWAIKMVDASSKLQSGIMGGNIADLGQYDECLEVEPPVFKAQYCLVNLIVHVNSSTKLHVPQDVLNGELTFTSALCVPSSCDHTMLEMAINSLLKDLSKNPYLYDYGLNITGKVNRRDCHTSDTTPLSLAEYVVIAVCSLFIALVIVSTVFDIMTRRKEDNRMSSKTYLVLTAFSAPRNCSRLLNTDMADGSLTCINGARFICIAWVALGHRYKFTCQLPLVNLLYLPEVLKSWWSMLIVNATLSVDVFFLLGGLLNAYIYMKAPTRKHNWKSTLINFVHRYLRLTPAYALMVAITATWIYRLGDGPLWDRVVGSASRDCQDQWLPGILYINNYYEPNNYCMMQSWYLAADMQMFWLSPLLLYPLWRWPKFGLIQGGVLIVLSIIAPFCVAYVEHIKTPIPLSRNTERVEREMKTLYLPTHTKTVSYIIGIFLGYLIYLIKTNRIKWNLSIGHEIVGWVLAIIFMAGSLFGAHPLFQTDHTYNRWESSLYIGFYRLFWALGVGWLILACCTGYGGILTKILNCKPFIVLGRLTYGIYLTHVAVIIQKLGSARQPTYLNHYDQIQQFLGEFLITILCALTLTLTLESPFLVMEKIVLRRRGTVAPENSVNLSGRNNGMETDESRIDTSEVETDESRRNSNSDLQRTDKKNIGFF